MESKAIATLIRKYEAGETSLVEESQLKDYFSTTEDIPKEWLPYRAFFGYFTEAYKETFPEQESSKTPSLYPWMAIAAMIAVILTVFLTTSESKNSLPPNSEELNLAFEQFQTNIQQVSNHLNKGVEQLAYLNYWNTTTQKLIK